MSVGLEAKCSVGMADDAEYPDACKRCRAVLTWRQSRRCFFQGPSAPRPTLVGSFLEDCPTDPTNFYSLSSCSLDFDWLRPRLPASALARALWLCPVGMGWIN